MKMKKTNNPTPLIDKATKLIQQKSNKVKTLSTGSYQVHLVQLDEGNYVLKNYGQDTINSKFQRKFLYPLEKETSGLKYRLRHPEIKQNFSNTKNLETKVLQNWEKENIIAPRVIEDNNYDKILLTYFDDATDYAALIHKGKFTQKHLDAFIQKTTEIRNKAFEKKDKFLLHNDLYLQNFMYSESKGAIPIDPGLLFKESMSFKELDAHINLFTSYACISTLLGYKPENRNIFDKILKSFLNSIEGSTLKYMRQINTPAHPLELSYLRFTSKLGYNKKYRNFIEIFNKKQYNRVNSELYNAIKKKFK